MELNIAKMMFHKWEEEPISGVARGYRGTFAIFFYGCNMRCVYCQNYKISHIKLTNLNSFENKISYSVDELSDIMIQAEKNKAASISLITGVLYVDKIVECIKIAKNKGLNIPVVYNSSAYELTSQINKLNGLIDIYLPDFKYFSNELSKKYSGVSNYVEIAKNCINEMYSQVGKASNNCIQDLYLKKGMIVRNLVLPLNTENSINVIKYLYDTYKDNIFISILNQYTPVNRTSFNELNRKITNREYNKVVKFAIDYGIKNAFIQEEGTASEEFIPQF